jgi:hypothetical protein
MLTWSFRYVQLLTWHCTLMYLNCGCVSFCNTTTTVTFLTATLPSHWSTLLLHVANWYVWCINRVSTSKFNTLLQNKCKALVRYHIRAFAWHFLTQKSNKYYIFWVCVCSLSYPPCKAQLFCLVLYCRPWPLWCHCIFLHNLINSTNFRKYLFKTKCVFWISFVWNISFREEFSTILSYMHIQNFM